MSIIVPSPVGFVKSLSSLCSQRHLVVTCIIATLLDKGAVEKTLSSSLAVPEKQNKTKEKETPLFWRHLVALFKSIESVSKFNAEIFSDSKVKIIPVPTFGFVLIKC